MVLTKEEAFTALQTWIRNQGTTTCRWLTVGQDCQCPLCLLDVIVGHSRPRLEDLLLHLDQNGRTGLDGSPGDPVAAEAAFVIRTLMSKGGSISIETANAMAKRLASLHETVAWDGLSLARRQYYRQQIGVVLEACSPGFSLTPNRG